MGDDVVERLRAVAPFSELAPATLAAVAGQAEVRQATAGETLAEAGSAAHEAFVVLDGALDVLEADNGGAGGQPAVLATLGAGQIVGEIAVVTGAPRTATIRAARTSDVVALSAEALHRLLELEPAFAGRLAVEARRRLDRAALAGHLARLFPDMGPRERAAVAQEARAVTLDPGEVAFREGDVADAAYVVISGRLRVVTTTDGDAVEPVADVGPGALIGEAALLEEGRRHASVVASRDSVLAAIDREAFSALILREPAVALPVARLVVARARDARQPYRRAPAGSTSVVLLPLDPAVDVAGLASAVASRWSLAAPTSHISRATVDRALSMAGATAAEPGTPDDLRVAEWLARATSEDTLTLLEADPELSPWTRRCLGRADHVVLVADAAADPGPRPLEHDLLADRPLGHQRVSLVLLHPDEIDHIRGTAAWLDARRLDGHYHVRLGADADVDRLARQLAGRPVGLVLGGGGARGFAQLGAVRALHEAGVPIDCVAGASIGATMAALLALGTSVDGLVAAAEEAFAKPIDYTLPVAGLAKGRRIAESASRAAGDRAIEDFWLPYLCTSTNLTRGEVRRHTRGDLAHALRASVAIPGVLPPVPDDGDLLVDGGVLNNLPVDELRRRHPQATLIAVDVAPPMGPRAKEDYGLSVSGAGVLWRRLVPGLRPPQVPGLTATLLRSIVVGAAADRDRHVEAGLADLYLPLDLRGVGMLAFEAVAEIAERGYEASREPVTAWASAQEGRWW